MNTNMLKYFSPEELADLESRGPEFLENFGKQLKSDLYHDSNHLYQKTQYKQLIKATEKYDGPLDHNKFTAEELINHAYEELVDQSHYLMSLLLKIKVYESQLQEYREMALYWRDKYQELQREVLHK